MDAINERTVNLGAIRWEAQQVRRYMAEYRAQRDAGVDRNGNKINEAGMAWLNREIADEESRIEALRRKFEFAKRCY